MQREFLGIRRKTAVLSVEILSLVSQVTTTVARYGIGSYEFFASVFTFQLNFFHLCSLIKKKRLSLLEKAAFIHLGCSPAHPPMEQPGPPVSLNSATAEAIELLDTGEKIFLFREPSDPTLALHNFPRKKKKNFLNSKKAARANVDS